MSSISVVIFGFGSLKLFGIIITTNVIENKNKNCEIFENNEFEKKIIDYEIFEN